MELCSGMFECSESEYAPTGEWSVSNSELHHDSDVGMLHGIQPRITARWHSRSLAGQHLRAAKIEASCFPILVMHYKEPTSKILVAYHFRPIFMFHIDDSTSKFYVLYRQGAVIGNYEWACKFITR